MKVYGYVVKRNNQYYFCVDEDIYWSDKLKDSAVFKTKRDAYKGKDCKIIPLIEFSEGQK